MKPTPHPGPRTEGGRRRVALVLLMGSSLAACRQPEPEADTLVTSIFPVAELTRALAGDLYGVVALLPPRASPATWEATPSQLRALAGAEGYVTVGGGLDDWLPEPEAGEGPPPHLRLTDGIALRASSHRHGEADPEDARDAGTGDPHVWLDPVLVRDHVVPRLSDFLVRLKPAREGAVRSRADTLRAQLTALDAEIRRILDAAPGRRFVATHDAWTYFAERYGLEPLGAVYERPGHEPSARGLARLVTAAREAGVSVVLAEPQLAETGARALAEELGATVEVVDPMGGPGLAGRETYFDMMRFNARAFARALGAAR